MINAESIARPPASCVLLGIVDILLVVDIALPDLYSKSLSKELAML